MPRICFKDDLAISFAFAQLTVAGTTVLDMTIFGMKFEMCQAIPPLQLQPDNPAEPGKLSVRFRLGTFMEPLGLGMELPDVDLTAFAEGLFGENFFDFVVLRYDSFRFLIVCEY